MRLGKLLQEFIGKRFHPYVIRVQNLRIGRHIHLFKNWYLPAGSPDTFRTSTVSVLRQGFKAVTENG